MFNLRYFPGPSVHAQDPVAVVRAQAWREERLAALAALATELQNRHAGQIRAHGVTRDAKGAAAFFGYHDQRAAELAARAAVLTLEQGPAGELSELLAQLEARCEKHHPVYAISRVAFRLARERGIPLRELVPGSGFLRFGTGARAIHFHRALSDADSTVGVTVAHNKAIATALVAQLGLPHPQQVPVAKRDAVRSAARKVGFPCVVKPLDQDQGRGVTVDVADEAAALEAFDLARRHSRAPVVIETFIEGQDIRLLVIGGRLVAAARRDPASATGDGASTLRQLVEATNRDRARLAAGENRGLYPIRMDAEMERWAAKQGFGLDSVVPQGQYVRLRGAANNHAGATPVDVLAQVHADVRSLAEILARTVGIHALGIDFISADITRSWRDVRCAVIELNQSPGLDVHRAAGTPTDPLAAAMLEPALRAAGRIPVVVVVDEAPGPLAAALAARLLTRAGAEGLGTVLPAAAALGGCGLDLDGRSTHARVEAMMGNRACEALLVACPLEEIRGAGFPVDRCDAVVLPRELRIESELRALFGRCSNKVIEADGADAAAPAIEAILMSVKE